MPNNIDLKIIDLLKRDGRYSCAAIAQDLGVNVATVTKHLERMLAEDVISIKTVLNQFKMGFNAHAFITLDVDLCKVGRVCEQLVESPNISLVVTTFGRYDLLGIADFQNWDILQEFIAKDVPSIDGIVKINAFPIVEIKKLNSGLFTYSAPVAPYPPLDPPLDGIDQAIIAELQNNGREPFTDLASRLNLSLTTVSRRVARLRRDEILGISAVRNPSKWGYLANAYVAVHADANKVQKICAELAAYPELHLIMTAMSGFEILVGIHAPNSEKMYHFIVEKIARIEGVTNLETFVCAEIHKRSFALFDSDKS
ncbi:MAG: Lrp/AsnC family transcriptional regulator [Dehalococcoidales bacterium]|nr:Lrp/AsnC family transcriptional regulator [Dehalococcoidales bacterium]